MVRVIDGKRYDTEKSVLVCDWDSGDDSSNFRFRETLLYRTRSGAWFIRHRGGALTDMAVSVGGNTTCGSSAIEPINEDDAFCFLEAHSNQDDAREGIEKYFADRVVDA